MRPKGTIGPTTMLMTSTTALARLRKPRIRNSCPPSVHLMIQPITGRTMTPTPQRPRIAGVRTVPFWHDCGDPWSNERQASVTQRNNIGIHRFHQAKTKKAVTSPIRLTTNNGLSLGTHFRHECQKRMQHLQGLFPNWWPWTSLVFRKKPN